MARWENNDGSRDQSYSKWHRRLDGDLAMMDLDALEFCSKDKQPLAAFELSFDVGQWKPTTVLRHLGDRLGIPAYLILYRRDEEGEFSGPLRVRRVSPDEQQSFEEWALDHLERLIRDIHESCPFCNEQEKSNK